MLNLWLGFKSEFWSGGSGLGSFALLPAFSTLPAFCMGELSSSLMRLISESRLTALRVALLFFFSFFLA